MTELERISILKQYRNGQTVETICNLSGLSRNAFYDFIKPYIESGVVSRRYADDVKRNLTPEEKQQIAEDYFVNGMKCFDLYKKWNINPVHLFQIRQEYSSIYTDTVRHQTRTREEYEQMATDYYVGGLSREQMKSKWGIKSNTTFDTLGKMFGEKYGKKKVGRRSGNKR